MIDINDVAIFNNKRKSLKELSRDTNNLQDIKHMTESTLEIISFDKVKTEYANNLKLSEEVSKSVDGLIFDKNKKAFLEFKNGVVKNLNVKTKIKDSLLIFCDLIEINISYTRENMDFILIYNEEKNPVPNQLQKSPSRSKIKGHFAKKSNDEIIFFGLEEFKTLYFRNVHTYTEKQFESYLQKIG